MSELGDRWDERPLSAEETDYRMLRESSILRWWNIPARKDVTVTIERISVAKDKKVGKQQLVLRFRGAKLPYLTNATANKTLATLYGNKPASWVGKRITLYRTTTDFGGQTVDCIRIRPRKPGDKQHDQLPDESAAAPIDETNADRSAPGAHRALSDTELDAARDRAAAAQPGHRGDRSGGASASHAAPGEPQTATDAEDRAAGSDEDAPEGADWPSD